MVFMDVLWSGWHGQMVVLVCMSSIIKARADYVPANKAIAHAIYPVVEQNGNHAQSAGEAQTKR
jgi:hypothetical protein